MENMKKENALVKAFNKIKAGWARLGELDINDGIEMDANIAKEVEEIKAVQAQVHEQKGFVQKAKVDEGKAKVSAKGKAQNRGDSQIVRGNA